MRVGGVLDTSSVVIVEGASDRIALETLAERRGRDLAAEGVTVVSIGGAHAIGNVLQAVLREDRAVRLAGLCDSGEEAAFRRGLERAGLASGLTRTDMEELGFYVCDPDLEGELIRSLGEAVIEQVIDGQGELGSFRTFQKQEAWRDRALDEQLRRFLGQRKIRYARVLVDALDLGRAPRPLDAVLARV
jgi:hypothetical protein